VTYHEENNGHQKALPIDGAQRWYEDGTLLKLKQRILAVAEEKGTIDWKYGAALGSFSPCPRIAVKNGAGFKPS
jgi:hypothetical protein